MFGPKKAQGRPAPYRRCPQTLTICLLSFFLGSVRCQHLALPTRRKHATGDHRVYREHAEQAGGRIVVLDLLHGGGVRGGPGFPEGAAPQDIAQVRRTRLPR